MAPATHSHSGFNTEPCQTEHCFPREAGTFGIQKPTWRGGSNPQAAGWRVGNLETMGNTSSITSIVIYHHLSSSTTSIIIYHHLSSSITSIIIYHHLSSSIIIYNIYHHLSSSITIYHHLSWSIMIYHNLSWSIMIYHDLSSSIIIYHHLSYLTSSITSWKRWKTLLSF